MNKYMIMAVTFILTTLIGGVVIMASLPMTPATQKIEGTIPDAKIPR